jgi:hypothetical protein
MGIHYNSNALDNREHSTIGSTAVCSTAQYVAQHNGSTALICGAQLVAQHNRCLYALLTIGIQHNR